MCTSGAGPRVQTGEWLMCETGTHTHADQQRKPKAVFLFLVARPAEGDLFLS